MGQTIERIPIAELLVAALPAGIKQRMHLVVDLLPDGQPLVFPALIARGRQPGPTLLTTGATHGDEYEGTVAIQDIYEQLDVAALRGTFLGIPVLNGPAFASGAREGSLDHLNLARIFPGSPLGSPSQRIAHAFQAYLVGQADLYLDIHSGGNAYAMKPFAGYQVRPGALGQRQRAAAIAFGLDLVWGSEPLPGRTLSAAGDHEVPAIYAELSGEGRCRPHDLGLATQGIRNIMAFMGMLDGQLPTEPPLCVETLGEQAGHLQIDHPSPTSGIFVADVAPWQAVAEGQRLGVVRHPDGTLLAEVPSARAGRVLFLRTFPRVISGDCLAYVLALPDSETTKGTL
jgi:predicted deacylase